MNGNLNNIERVAVARAVGSADEISKICASLTPGTYKGDLTVKIDFEVAKGSDTDAAAVANINSIAVLAKAIILSGVQRHNFYAAIKAAALAVAKGEKLANVVADEDERVAAEIEALKAEVVNSLPKIKRSGATRVKAVVSKVEEPVVSVNATVAAVANL